MFSLQKYTFINTSKPYLLYQRNKEQFLKPTIKHGKIKSLVYSL